MPFIPQRFLFRLAYRCCYQAEMPREMDELFELPEQCRLDNFAELDERHNFADVRLAWNETGLGVQVAVQGKEKPVLAAVDRLRFSDQLVLWIDTRDARTSHRASRTCHQFHFLPTGGGPEKDEPVFVQSKMNRAAQDAPLAEEGAVLYQCRQTATGYQMRAFLPTAVLNGFDPEQHPRLGVHYLIRDNELGEQSLSVGSDFPFADDPTLWSVLELVPPEGKQKRQVVEREEDE